MRKGTHVAVMPNVAAMPLSWLALGTLGAVMVPVNVNYLERELAYVINDSHAESCSCTGNAWRCSERCMAGGEIRTTPRIFVVDPPPGPTIDAGKRSPRAMKSRCRRSMPWRPMT